MKNNDLDLKDRSKRSSNKEDRDSNRTQSRESMIFEAELDEKAEFIR